MISRMACARLKKKRAHRKSQLNEVPLNRYHVQNSLRRTISITVAPYAYSMLWSRWIWEKLFFPRKLDWSAFSPEGIWTTSLFRRLIRRTVMIHCSVYSFCVDTVKEYPKKLWKWGQTLTSAMKWTSFLWSWSNCRSSSKDKFPRGPVRYTLSPWMILS